MDTKCEDEWADMNFPITRPFYIFLSKDQRSELRYSYSFYVQPSKSQIKTLVVVTFLLAGSIAHAEDGERKFVDEWQ